MWYNSKTGQIQSMPPWGSGWMSEKMIAEDFPDWRKIEEGDLPDILPKASNVEIGLAKLDEEYASLFAQLGQALNMANLAGNIELITELQAEYAEIKEQYQKEREVVINGD